MCAQGVYRITVFAGMEIFCFLAPLSWRRARAAMFAQSILALARSRGAKFRIRCNILLLERFSRHEMGCFRVHRGNFGNEEEEQIIID